MDSSSRTLPRLRLLPAALLLVSAVARAATPGVDAPPEAQPPRPVVLPPMPEERLPNGLRVIVAPRTDLPLVSARLLVRAGPETDPAELAGLSSMAATLLSKGATRQGRAVDATTLAQQAEALGGSLDTGSGWRSTTVSMTVTTPKLDAALALIADVARRPTLAADELERARTQALDSLRVALSSPGTVAGIAARQAYWGDSPYGVPVTPASLQKISTADIRRFHAQQFRPDQAALVLAGDIDLETAMRLARRHFGDWRAPRTPVPPLVSAQPRPQAESNVLVDMPGAGQSSVMVVGPFVALDREDRQTRRIGQAANVLLGGGYSARLNQEVRIKRGLSYGAGSDAEAHPGGGMWSASAQTQNSTAAQVLQVMREEVERLRREAPGREELEARKATLIGSFSRRLESVGGLAATVSGQVAQDRPLAELRGFVEEISAVTPQQVQGFAQKYWAPQALRGVIAGDLKAAGDLGALGAAQRLTVSALAGTPAVPAASPIAAPASAPASSPVPSPTEPSPAKEPAPMAAEPTPAATQPR
ncbi:M16 family metallopeptidase [Azohydromonas caseinilytica]|uniref:Insulinase family protein n=1 Tax=Azohydromonas caseinilytica TaxID=2728836 RepID=A0A848F2D1_9BURK|nr:pitrilysin family protein [Azohydromonas caseinilytica]NML13834.1 insulinase family protein [Azohydromonas caseinilytica]